MSSLDTLFAEHRRYYEPGTFERFQAWFARSGHTEMLDNSFLRSGPVRPVMLQARSLPFSKLRRLTFCNDGREPWRLGFVPRIECGANSVEALFRNFVRCTGHTHLMGDFRLHPGYFVRAYSGSRYFLFDLSSFPPE